MTEAVRIACPGCEEDVLLSREIVQYQYCCLHQLDLEGEDDSGHGLTISGGNVEAFGEDNRAFANVLHRDSPWRKQDGKTLRPKSPQERPS